MYKIKFEDVFDYPLTEVFATFRDKQIEYVKYVPNVSSVEIKERKQLNEHQILIKAEWMGLGQIPAAVRAILKPEMIKWKDDQIWDDKEMTCTWKIGTFYFKDSFRCEGQWKFCEEGNNKTIIKLNGILEIKIKSWPGVPKIIVQTAGGIIENFIGQYLKPNLKANNNAIKKLLKETERN